jgi:hypothetical protein
LLTKKEKVLTKKNHHLEREYINVHALAHQPITRRALPLVRVLLVVNLYEYECVDNEGDEEHDHEHVAHANRAIRAAIRVN